MDKKKIIFFITVALLVIAFAGSAFFVISYLLESNRQANMYAQYQQQNATLTTAAPTTLPPVTDGTDSTDSTEGTESTEAAVSTDPTQPQILPEMQTYYNDNPHTVGYIDIAGTVLSYPVVQTMDDRDYYLERDFQGKYSQWGTIYAELADINEPSDNVTLYGHNMRDGSMFASLHKYQDKEYWEEHQYISFNTLYERHSYRIFAVFKTSGYDDEGWSYHKFIDAENEEEFNEFVRIAKEGQNNGKRVISFYDTGITPVYGDKLLTLSTCEYTMGTDRNGRLVVCAVRWDRVN